jgi:hypothetical protein
MVPWSLQGIWRGTEKAIGIIGLDYFEEVNRGAK